MVNRTRQLTLSAMFMALGILIPFLFHGLGLGPMFLPMFWPIAAGAFFLPVSLAAIVGGLTPLVSMLMTGMPPVPVLYKMIFELAVLGGAISFLYTRTRYGIFWLVLAGMIISRFAAMLGSAALAPILGLPVRLYAFISLVEGIPGMITIQIIIPILLLKTKRESLFNMREDDV